MADEALPQDGDEGVIDAPAEDDGVVTTEVIHEDEGQEEAPAPTIEDLAADMGWRPQDEWRGDPNAWKPAADFVRSTVDVNSKLKNSIKNLEQQVSTIARTSASMTERAVAQERQRLLNERQQAFDEGDSDKFNKVDKELSKLQSQPLEQQITPPETQQFLERNPWMNTDAEAAAWAQHRAGELANQGIGPARQLAIVEQEAKNLFPEHFEQQQEAPKPRQGVPLNKPGNRGGKPAPKGFASLPKDAQQAALDYEKRGVCTKEEYAQTYFEEEA